MTRLDLTGNKQPSNNYDCRLSVDTMYLTAKLSEEERSYIYDRFRFDKNSPKYHWRYRQNKTIGLGFSLYTVPNNPYTNRHYNFAIQLQRGITTSDYMPYSLAEIINEIDWNIKRVDLAFDLRILPEKSLVVKHHGNVQFEYKDEWDTEYLGKFKSKSASKLAFYDRNDKELDLGSTTKHEYNNRFEVRIFPASNDETMKFHAMQDDFILKHLTKYIIIPDIDALPTSKPNKKKLDRIKADYDHLKMFDKKKQKELKDLTKAHRIPLEQIYLASKDKLFQFKVMAYNALELELQSAQ